MSKVKSLMTEYMNAEVFYRLDKGDHIYEICVGSDSFSDAQWFAADDLDQLAGLATKLAKKLRKLAAEQEAVL